MAYVGGVLTARKRRKKVLKLTKDYWGMRSKHFKIVRQTVMKSDNCIYIGYRHREKDPRRLWITRISAACEINGVNYSSFMNDLKRVNITLNCKMLSEIAVSDEAVFQVLVERTKAAL